jgi:hypothetical protein
LHITSSCEVLIHAGWDRARSIELHKRSRSHHGRENYFFGALPMLGFIRRLLLEFRDHNTLKSFYTSLIRLKLEWCSCWQSGTHAKTVYSICFAWFGLDINVLKKPDCFRTTNFILLIVLCWTTVFRTYLYTKPNDRNHNTIFFLSRIANKK